MSRSTLSPFVLLLGILAAGIPAEARSSRLKLIPCRLPEVKTEARCGTYEVFENRAARRGRKIRLRVVVLPARERPVSPDPVVFFEGGPGASAIDSAPDVEAEMGEILRHRDILLVDVRGTGQSGPLDCPQPDGDRALEEALDTFMDPAAIRHCRDVLAREHDLSQYTTETIVDDVDEVRAALGYSKVNLSGASYGTRAALIYLRRHPDRVRTVFLFSVVPQDARIPTFLAAHTQAAFDRLAADCAADPGCRAAFPDPAADLRTVLERLAARPAEVPVQGEDGRETRLRLSREGAVQSLRYLLYRPVGARALPLMLRRAAEGDLQPLAQAAHDIAGAMLLSSPDGLYLSVTCAEDVAFVDREAAARRSADSFVGDFRLRQQVAACAEWPAAKLPASFLEPVRSSVPVLIFAGENDPTTPLEWAERVARTLPRSRIVAVPGGAHTFYGLKGIECLDRLNADFVARGEAEGLDVEACRRAIQPAPFALP